MKTMLKNFALLVFSALLVATPAFGWETTPAHFSQYSCTGSAKVTDRTQTCLATSNRVIATASGPLEVRYKLRRGKNVKELNALLTRQGMPEGALASLVVTMGLPEKKLVEKLVVRGLVTADGSRELLPPVYSTVFPVSDTVFVVGRFDGKYGILDTRKSDLPTWLDMDIDDVVDFQPYASGVPYQFAMRSDAGQGYLRYAIVSPLDGSLTVIDNVVGGPKGKKHAYPEVSKYAHRDFNLFGPDWIGFNVRFDPQTPAHEPEIDGADAAVIVDMRTGYIDRLATPMQWVVERDKDGDWARWTAMHSGGPVKPGLEASGREMLLLYDAAGYPDRRPLNGVPLVGMIPLSMDLISPVWVDGWKAADLWAIIHDDGEALSFRLITGLGKDEDNLLPDLESLARASDLWYGRTNVESVKSLLNPDEADDYFLPSDYLALRGLRHAGSDGGVLYDTGTDWVAFQPRVGVRSLIHRDTRTMMERPSFYFSDVATGATALEAANRRVVHDIRLSAFFSLEAIAARREEEERALERKYQAYVASARLIMEGQGGTARANSDFRRAALFAGGDVLEWYFGANRNSTDFGFAQDICDRFGELSGECNTVRPWLEVVYAERARQNAIAIANETNRVAIASGARQQAMTRPSYSAPKKPEIRYCWSQNGFWNC